MADIGIRAIDEIVAELRERAASHAEAGEIETAAECRHLVDKSLHGGRLIGSKHLQLYKKFESWTNDYLVPETFYESPSELTEGLASALNGTSHITELEFGAKYGPPSMSKICAEGIVAGEEQYAENWFLANIRTRDLPFRIALARAIKPINCRPKIQKQLIRGLKSKVPEYQVACADSLAGSLDAAVQRALAKALKRKPDSVNTEAAFDYYPYDDSVQFQRDACYPRNPVRYSFAKALCKANTDDEQVVAALSECLQNDEHLGVKIRCPEALRDFKNKDALFVLNSFCTGVQTDRIPVTDSPEIPYTEQWLEESCTYAICYGDWTEARSILEFDNSVEAKLIGALRAFSNTRDQQVQRFLVTLCDHERFTHDGDLCFPLADALRGHSDPVVRAKLVSQLESSDLCQKTLSATALADTNDPQIVAIVVSELRKQQLNYDPDASKALFRLLHGSEDSSAIQVLTSILKQADPNTTGVSVHAANALSGSNSPEASEALLAGLYDNRHPVRKACAMALQGTRNLDVIDTLLDNLFAMKSLDHLAASALALKGQFGALCRASKDLGIEYRVEKLPITYTTS